MIDVLIVVGLIILSGVILGGGMVGLYHMWRGCNGE